ncbi:hypothetical protein AVEN_16422-1 [Araneus ventricosus]|uniref:Tc3 transposase DNA binding domain-containing protein n=1 Tax=Araneus ventricosus TaxID=182803 RepID=A0A4Y2F1C6_ARAVE|nr:hypothetical protein AVEN_16422-1 [Araneus ventricosus]
MYLKGKEITHEEGKIVLKVTNEGKTFREVVEIVGRTHSSIQRVRSNYNSSKSIIPNPRNGRPSTLTNREIFKSVRLNPRITASQIVNQSGERFPPKKIFHEETIRIFLKKPDYHWPHVAR